MGFFAGVTLKRIDVAGGAPQTLASVSSGFGATWGAEGVIVFAPSPAGALMRVSAGGGTVTALTTLAPQQSGHRMPFFLPDGRRFLFTSVGGPGLYVGSLDGSDPTWLAPDRGQAVYLPAGSGTGAGRDGWVLWGRTGTLVAERLDLNRPALVGDPVTIADGFAGAGPDPAGWSVAAPGLVAFRAGARNPRQLTWVDRSGTRHGTLGDPDSNLERPRLSPDGLRAVVDRAVQGNADVWLMDGTRTSRLTFDRARDAVWSPDGTRIVFRNPRVAGGLDQTRANGAGGAERLVVSDQNLIPNSWSQDGRFLLYHSNDPQTSGDLWVVPMVGDRTPSMFLKTPFREAYGAFSPDGRWVAYHSDASGRHEIYIRQFVPPGATRATAAAAGGQWQVSAAGGIMAMWRPDGKELYYLNPAGDMMAAPITVVGDALEPGAPVVLFPTRIAGGGSDNLQGRQYDVAPDGRFLINTELPGNAAPITLIQHWNPETKQ